MMSLLDLGGPVEGVVKMGWEAKEDGVGRIIKERFAVAVKAMMVGGENGICHWDPLGIACNGW